MFPPIGWRRTDTQQTNDDNDKNDNSEGKENNLSPAHKSDAPFDGSSRYVIHLTNSLAGSGLLACAKA